MQDGSEADTPREPREQNILTAAFPACSHTLLQTPKPPNTQAQGDKKFQNNRGAPRLLRSAIPARLPALPAPLPRSRAMHEGAGTAHSHSCFQTAAGSSRLGNPSRIRSAASLTTTLPARNHWDRLS